MQIIHVAPLLKSSSSCPFFQNKNQSPHTGLLQGLVWSDSLLPVWPHFYYFPLYCTLATEAPSFLTNTSSKLQLLFLCPGMPSAWGALLCDVCMNNCSCFRSLLKGRSNACPRPPHLKSPLPHPCTQNLLYSILLLFFPKSSSNTPHNLLFKLCLLFIVCLSHGNVSSVSVGNRFLSRTWHGPASTT